MDYREADCTTTCSDGRAHFTMVSISRYVQIIASGRFSQTRSHILFLIGTGSEALGSRNQFLVIYQGGKCRSFMQYNHDKEGLVSYHSTQNTAVSCPLLDDYHV